MIERRYALTDHCCKACLGRILERNGMFMCADCETMAARDVTAICGCGMRAINSRALPGTLRDAFRCGINPLRTAASPARIVVLYGGRVVDPVNA